MKETVGAVVLDHDAVAAVPEIAADRSNLLAQFPGIADEQIVRKTHQPAFAQRPRALTRKSNAKRHVVLGRQTAAEAEEPAKELGPRLSRRAARRTLLVTPFARLPGQAIALARSHEDQAGPIPFSLSARREGLRSVPDPCHVVTSKPCDHLGTH